MAKQVIIKNGQIQGSNGQALVINEASLKRDWGVVATTRAARKLTFEYGAYTGITKMPDVIMVQVLSAGPRTRYGIETIIIDTKNNTTKSWASPYNTSYITPNDVAIFSNPATFSWEIDTTNRIVTINITNSDSTTYFITSYTYLAYLFQV